LSSGWKGTCRKAFTLVESVLAIGVVSFAMVSMIGLIPVGLDTFRTAMTVSVESGIANGLAVEAQRSDFATLPKETVFYYFDEEGIRIDDKASAIFVAEMTKPEPLVMKSAEGGQDKTSGIPAWSISIKVTSKMNPGAVNSHSVIVLENQ
jgi:uncharacterized protein (TIGR02598 family)